MQTTFSLDLDNFSLIVYDNIFTENPGSCINMSSSVKTNYIKISNNHFKTNLYDITCKTRSNEKKIIVKRNTFEVAPGNPEKTIKITKRFKNLNFKDNEFIKIKEEKKDNIWLRLLGCADQKEPNFFSNENSISVFEKREKLEKNNEENVIVYQRNDHAAKARSTLPDRTYKMHNILDQKRKSTVRVSKDTYSRKIF
jgi:hypothetical protein